MDRSDTPVVNTHVINLKALISLFDFDSGRHGYGINLIVCADVVLLQQAVCVSWEDAVCDSLRVSEVISGYRHGEAETDQC